MYVVQFIDVLSVLRGLIDYCYGWVCLCFCDGNTETSQIGVLCGLITIVLSRLKMCGIIYMSKYKYTIILRPESWERWRQQSLDCSGLNFYELRACKLIK